jgi:hypothetical protein
MLSLFVLVHKLSTGRLDRIELCTGFCGWILENWGWPVDNSALTSAAARRGERKSEKGSDGAFPYHQKFYQLVKVLPFGQSICTNSLCLLHQET